MRHKLYSLVNIAGLALGMACCFMILIFVRHELSYDRFHAKGERIYRLNYHPRFLAIDKEVAKTPPPIAPLLSGFFPEVEMAARLFPCAISAQPRVGDRREQFEVERVFFADPEILQIFSFQALDGQVATALDEPYSLVLAESAALRFFGTVQAVGKTLWLKGRSPFHVKAVVEDFPANSHIHFDMLVPYANMADVEREDLAVRIREDLPRNWVITHGYTYVLLREGYSPAQVDARFAEFLFQHSDRRSIDKQAFSLQVLADIHLRAGVELGPEPVSDRAYLYVFMGIGLAILLIACINFVNLSTACSFVRAREVGVRKVLGASRGELAVQFLGESLLISAIAFVCALGVVEVMLPALGELTGRALAWGLVADWPLNLNFLALFLITGLLAGGYPALFVSRFQPVPVLKGAVADNNRKPFALRKVLVTLQSAASIALLICAFIMFEQVQLLGNRPLGFQKEQIVTVPLFSQSLNTIYGGVNGPLRGVMNTFEEAVLAHPRIEKITASSRLPGTDIIHRMVVTDAVSAEDKRAIAALSVDYDFAETFGLELVVGRDFNKSFGNDHQHAFIINERAVPFFGWENAAAAIGESIDLEGKQGVVVGVVRNFHHKNLRSVIDPLLLDVNPSIFTVFALKIHTRQVRETLDFIADTWAQFFPEKVFSYQFLDDEIDRAYKADQRLAKAIGYFAMLAVVITCIGLYGLVSYAVLQRKKETGIRKVLGASAANIAALFMAQFAGLVLLGNALAWPLAYYAMGQWLRDFAYRVDLGLPAFLLGGGIVLGIAVLSISVQVLRSARLNPVEALRSE